MKVFHGTSGAAARSILEKGIVPRVGRPSNWNVESGTDRVYVSTIYAPYFAINAAHKDPDGSAGIVEIDLGEIPRQSMLPDEDWCEQTNRRAEMSGVSVVSDGPPIGYDMHARTSWFRDNIDQFSHQALASLRDLGVMAVRGGIPVQSVTKVSLFDPTDNPMASFTAMDPSITLANHALMYEKYEALTDWFMGEKIDHVWAKRFLTVGGVCTAQNADEVLDVARSYNRRHITILRP